MKKLKKTKKKHPELILAAYDNMPSNYEESETEAIAALWNVKSEHKLPQQVFTSTVIQSLFKSVFQYFKLSYSNFIYLFVV